MSRRIVAVGRLWRSVRRRVWPFWWRVAQPPAILPPLVVQCLKIAVGSGLAWWIGPFVGLPHPFNAVLAVIILMQGNAYGSLRNALEFLLGVAVGLFLGILAGHFIGLSPLALAAVLFVCLLLGGWIRVSRQGFNNQIAVSALLVLASGSAANVDRLWETVLGGGIGVAVAALLWPPNPVQRLRQHLRDLSGDLREDVRRCLEAAGSGNRPEAEANRRQVRAHSEDADRAVTEVAPAQDALRWNPWHFRRVHDLSQLEDRLRLIAYLYRTVRALARQASESPVEAVREWEDALPRLRTAGAAVLEAIDRRLMRQDPGPAVEQGSVLIAEFAARAPRERHAVALAAVLEDLLNDVAGWHGEKQVHPDRRLMARVLRRLGHDRVPQAPVQHRAESEFHEELGHAQSDRFRWLIRPRRDIAPPPLADITAATGVSDEVDRGVQAIPITQIRGVERRSRDFDTSFTPRSARVRDRWVETYTRMERQGTVDPIDVYKVGQVYFVRHGHTRVSVARRLGWPTIPGRVTEVNTRAPVPDDLDPEDLLRASEYARFLERTELDQVRPQARLDCSELGRFDLILDHIEGHRYFLEEAGHDATLPEAAASWYDSVYLPVMAAVRRARLRERLPGWTDTDLYLALTQVWLEEGRESGPEQAADVLAHDAQPAQHLPRGVTPGRRRPRSAGRRPPRSPS